MSQNFKDWNHFFFLWLVSLVATLGSLFFSEVLEYPPCVLCWYQRIFMYSLTIIFSIRLFRSDKIIVFYTLPLAFLGWAIALYHNLLYYKILPESVAPCTKGISCTSVHIEWLGFITIPFLSLTAFSIIIFIILYYLRGHFYEK